jgi:hypothetical protein
MPSSPTPSEFALFQKLANPHKTDFSRRTNGDGNSFKTAVRQQMMRPASVVMPPPSSYQRSHAPQASSSHQRSRAELRSAVRSTAPPPDARSHVSSRASSPARSDRSRSPRSPPPSQPSPRTPPSRSEAPPSFYPEEQRNDAGSVNGGVSEDLNQEIDSEKQGYLLELVKFEQQGIALTRRYTMTDSLEEIQFEYDRIRTHLDTVNAVSFMRDTMLLGFQGIELANGKWGPILELNGWAKKAGKDRKRYDHVIERLYKKHWRRGNMSPEMEFGWLIGSSMVMHHVEQKWGGGGGGKKKKKRRGDDDNDDDDDDEDEGGSQPKSRFDLSSMLGGMLPKFPGSGNKPTPLPTVHRQQQQQQQQHNNTDSGNSYSNRPIMRGPSTPAAFPQETPVVPVQPGPSTIRTSALGPPGGLAEHAHRMHGQASELSPMPSGGMTLEPPMRAGSVLSGTVHAPVNVPVGLQGELQQEHNKHAMEREMRQLRAHMEVEMAETRRMRQETVLLREELRVAQQPVYRESPPSQHAHTVAFAPVVPSPKESRPATPEAQEYRIMRGSSDDDDDDNDDDDNDNDDDENCRDVSIVGRKTPASRRSNVRKTPVQAIRLDM